MVFSSLEFMFLFLTATLLVYFVVPLAWRNPVLLGFSLLFYGWVEPVYVLLMVFTILVDYISGIFVDKNLKNGNRKGAKLAMIGAIVINLGTLGFFKYFDFFVKNLALIPFFSGLKPLGIGLPIGISFYTFQSLSYVIDVYRGDGHAQYNVATFGTYVTLFPQLVAGPIVRYKDVDEQLVTREHSIPLFASGVRTFIAGLSKKVLLANTAGAMWKTLSEIPTGNRTVVGCWLGIIFYAFQIYFDFSGYSDMAIGLGKMFGFTFLENFNYPYISKSITEFWRRWHISLSTWFREYVYIPLGGNRSGKAKQIRNIFIVWFLTGFWHGASWNYILWGLYFFALLMIEKLFLLKKLEKAPAFVSHAYALLFILFGWLLFVFEDLPAGGVWLGNMFGVGVSGFVGQFDLYTFVRSALLIVILAVASTPLPKKIYLKLTEKSEPARIVFAVGSLVLTLLSVAYLVASKFNPFLYTRF